MKNALIKVDLYKLVVLIILIIALIILVREEPAALVSREKTDDADTQQLAENNLEREASTVQTPPLPKSDDSLKLNEAKTGLLDTDGVLCYQLSEDKEIWVPLIPEVVLKVLPDDYALISDEFSEWYIADGKGEALYYFKSDILEWNVIAEKIMEEQDASRVGDGSEIPACEGAKPARLTLIGSPIKVVNALIPLRSSPDAESANYMLSLPKGTHLEVVSLPVCTRFLSGANLWWGVRTESGLEGWAAEASAISDVYYLQEIK